MSLLVQVERMRKLVEMVSRACSNPATPWVLFSYGTVVFLPKPEGDLAAQATRLLEEWGPAQAGSPSGDFGVSFLKKAAGWAVSCHHPDLITFLDAEEMPEGTPDLTVGLAGRDRRDQDARDPRVIHVHSGDPEALALAVANRSPLLAAFESLQLSEVGDLTPETPLEAFIAVVDALPDPAAEVRRLLSSADTREAGALAVLLKPNPETIGAVWEAIDDDDRFHYHLVAVAACTDREAVARARKRILLGEGKLGRDHTCSQRTCCLLQVIWQNPDYREWVRTRIPEFKELCKMEWLHEGRKTRQFMVRAWESLSKALPQLCLPAPEQPANLVELCWPKRWRGPLPGKVMRPLLVEGKPTELAHYLFAESDFFLVEDEETGAGSLIVREGAMTLLLPKPYDEIFKSRIFGVGGVIGTLDRGRWEIRRHGALYFLDRTPLEKVGCALVVTGIDHDGKMKGATAVALRNEGGPKLEEEAREALARTDRSLGTVVVTRSHGVRHTRYVAHVVSTPRQTRDWPGWVAKAVPRVLDAAAELDVMWVAFSALGTAGGITPEQCARLMLDGIDKWFAERRQKQTFKICFSLPAEKVYKVFAQELRRRNITFHVPES